MPDLLRSHAPFLLPHIVRQRVQKAQGACGGGLAGAVHGVDGFGVAAQGIVQQGDEVAGLPRRVGHHVGQAGDAGAVFGEGEQGFAVVGGDVRGDVEETAAAVFAPAVARVGGGEAEQAVLRQIFGAARGAVSGEVGGGGDGAQRGFAEQAGVQGGVGQVAGDADGEVGVLFNQIDDAVVAVQLDKENPCCSPPTPSAA